MDTNSNNKITELTLFDVSEFEIEPEQDDVNNWREEWKGMPEYIQQRTEYHCIKVSFVTKQDMVRFSELINQKVGLDTKIVYYPDKIVDSAKGKIYIDES